MNRIIKSIAISATVLFSQSIFSSTQLSSNQYKDHSPPSSQPLQLFFTKEDYLKSLNPISQSHPYTQNSQAISGDIYIENYSWALDTGIDKDGQFFAVRIHYQSHWKKPIYDAESWKVNGYWETTVGYYRADEQQKDVGEISFRPMVKFESEVLPLFFEVGTGPTYLTSDHIGDQDLGNRVHFGSSFGIGIQLGEHKNYKMMAKYHHISNAGLADPNPGIDIFSLEFKVSF